MKITNTYVLLFLCLFSSLGGSDKATAIRSSEYLERRIRISDGIDHNEAEILASAYFMEFIGLCGGIGFLKETEAEWEYIILYGYAATKLEHPIVVSKDGRYVAYREGPKLVHQDGQWLYPEKEHSLHELDSILDEFGN